MNKADRLHLEAKMRGEATARLLEGVSPELSQEFRRRLSLTVARFGGRPKNAQDAEWMLSGLWDLVYNFFRDTALTREDVEREAAALRAEGWRPTWLWPHERGGPSMGSDGRSEATVEGLLKSLAERADYNLRRLAGAIEARDMVTLSGLLESAYPYVSVLRSFQNDFELPGEWPGAINDIFNEFEYLRALAVEIQRRKMA